MAQQGVKLTIQDGGLGQTTPGAGNTLVVVGTTKDGAANTPTSGTNPKIFTDDFTTGPGVEAAALISDATGNPVIFIKAATTTPGVNSNVQPGATNTSGCVVTITGTPLDTYYVVVTVVTAGTVGTVGCVISISLDAGRTIFVTVNLGIATSYAVPNTGITLNFASGTLVKDDTFSFYSTEPKASAASVVSALASLLTGQEVYENILIVGDTDSGEATSYDAQATVLFNHRQYTRILTNARDALWGGVSTETEQAWMTAIETDFQNFVSDRISVSGGHYDVISPISQTQFRRPLSWLAAVRDASVTIATDLGRVADGPLKPMVVATKPRFFAGSSTPFQYHDETARPGLDAARFLSAYTNFGFPGFYILNPNCMAGPASDFNWLQHGEVIDEGSFIAYMFFTLELSNAVKVNRTTGRIDPAFANDIDSRCNGKLDDGLGAPGFVTAATCLVDRTNNILGTSELLVNIAITPLAYLKAINVTLQLKTQTIQAV